MKRYAVANWKMNLPPEGIDAFVEALTGMPHAVIAPPFPYLKSFDGRVKLAGQSCADRSSGAFTGEVSAAMLRDCGAQFVIVGHSERRYIFGETDESIALKLSLAIEAGLTPIFCVGETRQVRDAGEATAYVASQIRAVSVPALSQAGEIVVAYEPVWAIGTGHNATGAMVAQMVEEIRAALGRFWPERFARSSPILYGGSVTPDNIDDLGRNGRIEGYLVGGASLDSRKFLAICRGTAQLRPA